MRKALLLILPLLATACSSPKPNAQSVQSALSKSLPNQPIQWNQSTADDQQADAAVDRLLASPLTPDTAVTVSLLRNRSLQATYESLGLAQSDLVQAGLLANPSLSAAVEFPVDGTGKSRLDLGLSQNLLTIFLIPLRKKLAAAELNQATLHVADAVLQTAHDTRIAYYTLAIHQQQFSLRQQRLDAAQAVLTLTRRQHDAGSITDLALATEEAQLEQDRLDLAHFNLTLDTDRESLNRLLGLSTPPTRWKLATTLPPIPTTDPTPDSLQSAATQNRLDLQIARSEVAIATTHLTLARHNILTNLSPGVGAERETQGPWTVGPSVDLDLPIFDQGQARIPRAEGLLRQAKRRLEALESNTASEIRLFSSRLLAARQSLTLYEKTLLPLQKKVYDLTLQHYNAMTATPQDLLTIRNTELTTEESHLTTLLDYYTTLTDLERATASPLPTSNKQPATSN